LQKAYGLRRAIGLVWQSAPRWTVASGLLLIVQGIVPLLGLYLTKQLVDTIAWASGLADRSAAFGQVGVLVALLAGTALLSTALDALVTLVGEAQGQAVTDHMLQLLHAKAIEVDLEYYENPQYHDTLHRAQQDAPTRPTRIVHGLLQLGQSVVSLVGIGVVIATLHWGVALLLLAASLPGILGRVYSSREVFDWRRSRTATERQAHYFNVLLTLPDFAKEIRLFQLGPHFAHRARELRQQLFRERLGIGRRRTLREFETQAISLLPVYGSCGYVAYQTVLGGISLGGLVMYFQAFQRAQTGLRTALTSLTGLYEDSLFIANLYEFLDLRPKVVATPTPRPFPRPMREGISLEHVSFNYPASQREALIDVSLAIRPGEIVAIVGANGSGKTTLIKLLCRLYDPNCGSIRIDGIDLREFRTADLRSAISVVFQDYGCYYLTARENIWFGDLAVAPDDPRVQTAAEQSGAESVIARLPRGYETFLGKYMEDGENISVGEWQKVALARAFLRDAQVLVLDEPTSALDPAAEAEVFARFRQLIGGRAAVVISHRLSTVRLADRIYVFEDGRVVESGSHDTLMRESGRYAHLFETQALYYREEALP
jgi:ATP-binding cassette subfamily B protein